MANTRIKEEPAFPSGTIAEGSGCSYTDWHDKGMSLRDYFAAVAMGAIITTRFALKQREQTIGITAEIAYQVADAMLKARREQ